MPAKFVTFILQGDIDPEQVEAILENYGTVRHDEIPTWTYGGKQASWGFRSPRIFSMFVQLERGLIDGRRTWRLLISQRPADDPNFSVDPAEQERNCLAVIERVEADLAEQGYEPDRYEGYKNTPGERWGYVQAGEGESPTERPATPPPWDS